MFCGRGKLQIDLGSVDTDDTGYLSSLDWAQSLYPCHSMSQSACGVLVLSC